MRNASGPQGEIEQQRKKVNRNSYDISSIKRVTRIWEISGSYIVSCKTTAKKCTKYCAVPAKLFFAK